MSQLIQHLVSVRLQLVTPPFSQHCSFQLGSLFAQNIDFHQLKVLIIQTEWWKKWIEREGIDFVAVNVQK